jgi:hypothetical protein
VADGALTLTSAPVIALTPAQTAFSVALGIIALGITGFALYVASSTLWGDRWVRRSPR